MILIAESGSTKTQWCTLSNGIIGQQVNTPGINPLLVSVEEIEGAFRPVIAEIEESPVKIYFFGAGCSSVPAREKITKALTSLFKCNDIYIGSDLVAACYALAGREPGIVGLLGTGSNSCLWDGSSVVKNVPSLGYILGDEGGGVSLGKQLVADFLKNQMPLHLRIKFIGKYDLSVKTAVERVYQKPMPNRYLAGFAPFLEDNIEDDYCRSIVFGQFDRFVLRNILQYENYTRYETHFCGSIAYGFRQILTDVCLKYRLCIGQIVKEPLLHLAGYLKLYGDFESK
jgi:N-acetylglucosamine kinase-like BadF-type ATPase